MVHIPKSRPRRDQCPLGKYQDLRPEGVRRCDLHIRKSGFSPLSPAVVGLGRQTIHVCVSWLDPGLVQSFASYGVNRRLIGVE